VDLQWPLSVMTVDCHRSHFAVVSRHQLYVQAPGISNFIDMAATFFPMKTTITITTLHKPQPADLRFIEGKLVWAQFEGVKIIAAESCHQYAAKLVVVAGHFQLSSRSTNRKVIHKY